MKERNNNNKQRVEKWKGGSLIWERPDRNHQGPGEATDSANENKAGKTEAARKANTASSSSLIQHQNSRLWGSLVNPPPPRKKTKVLRADGAYPLRGHS